MGGRWSGLGLPLRFGRLSAWLLQNRHLGEVSIQCACCLSVCLSICMHISLYLTYSYLTFFAHNINVSRRSMLISGYVTLSFAWLLAAGTVVLGRLDRWVFVSPESNHTSSLNQTTINATYTSVTRPTVITTLAPSLAVYRDPSSLNTWTPAFVDPFITSSARFTPFGLSGNDMYGWFHNNWDFQEYSGILRCTFVAVLCLIAFVHAFTVGAAMTAVSAELFPLRARMKSVGLSLSCNSVSAFVSTYLMQHFLREGAASAAKDPGQQLPYLMLIFSVIAIIVGLFVFLMLPETKGVIMHTFKSIISGALFRLFISFL